MIGAPKAFVDPGNIKALFREDTKTIATEKLQDLSELQQEVNISMITLEDLKDISLTKDEIDAIMFMIKDE